MKRTQAGPPVAWIWAGVALLAVLLISVLFWVLRSAPGDEVPSNARIVPDVTGMTYERANDGARRARTCSRSASTSRTPTCAIGNVIRTDPGAGAIVESRHQVIASTSRPVRSRRPCPIVTGHDAGRRDGRAHGRRARRSDTITRENSRTSPPAP